MYDIVAFDCDGVMFDTADANRAYYDQICARMGRQTVTDDEFAYAQMHTVDKSLARLFPNADDCRAAHAIRKETGYHSFIDRMQMAPGLIPLLNRLRPEHITAVATNRTDTMDRVLTSHGLTEMFDMVVCASDVPRPKPAPDCLMAILDRFRRQPGQLVYIGDSRLDQEAASAAGVGFIAFGNPALTADYHVSQMDEISRILGVTA